MNTRPHNVLDLLLTRMLAGVQSIFEGPSALNSGLVSPMPRATDSQPISVARLIHHEIQMDLVELPEDRLGFPRAPRGACRVALVWIIGICLLPSAAVTVSAQDVSWEQVTTRGGGSVYRVHEFPGGALIAAVQDDLYRSADDGEAWSLLPFPKDEEQPLALPFQDIHIAPAGIAYVATGIVTASGGTYQRGAYSSLDGGRSWERLEIGVEGTLIYDFTTVAGETFAATSAGLYVSGDAGRNWEAVGAVQRPLTSAAATGEGIVALGGDSLVVSSDGGDTWATKMLPGGYRSRLVLTPGGILIAWVSGEGAIYRSGDLGDTWVTDSPPPVIHSIFEIRSGSGGLLMMAAGSAGAWMSGDYGVTWTPMGLGDKVAQSLCLTAGEGVIAGTGDGVYTLGADGAWRDSSRGIERAYLDALAVSEYREILSGDWVSGRVSLRDDGDRWVPLGYFEYVTAAAFGSAGEIFVSTGTPSPSVHSTSDEGANWTPHALAGVLKLERIDEDLYALGENTHRWDGSSASWEVVGGLSHRVRDLEEEGGTLYAATEQGAYTSTDAHTWAPISGTETEKVFEIAEHGGALFIAVELVSEEGGVPLALMRLLRLADGEVTEVWPAISWIGEIMSLGESLYMVTLEGLVRSDDLGESWTPLRDGFYLSPNGSLRSPLVDVVVGPQHHLYAVTFGSGLYRTTEPVTTTMSTEVPPESTFEIQPYPNPSHGQVTFAYTLDGPVDAVEVHIFDTLGRRVAALSAGPHSAGEHVLIWDGSWHAAGLYHYVVRAGDWNQAGRFALVE